VTTVPTQQVEPTTTTIILGGGPTSTLATTTTVVGGGPTLTLAPTTVPAPLGSTVDPAPPATGGTIAFTGSSRRPFATALAMLGVGTIAAGLARRRTRDGT
jgi:hypothetical protein